MTTTTAPIATAAPRRGRRVLVPLATLAAAGALAVGSGASFSSQTENAISTVTAGTLLQENTRENEAIFDVSNIKPGDTVTGSLTITNSGTLPAAFTLTEFGDANGFEADVLSMTITEVGGAQVFAGEFGDLVSADLGAWTAGEARSFDFVVSLAQAADNDNQGAEATASYRWSAVQLDGVDVDQSGDRGEADVVTETDANPALTGLAAG